MPIQFEDQNNLLIRRNVNTQNYGPIVSFLLKHHIAKSEKTANKILLIIAIIIFISAVTLTTINIIKANTPTKVKYNFSKEAFDRLPENVKIKILAQ